MQVICVMLDGRRRRVYLSEGTKVVDKQRAEGMGPGLTLVGVWKGPQTGRVIVGVDSIWEDPRTHMCRGTSYHEADPEEIAKMAESHECPELLEMVPAAAI